MLTRRSLSRTSSLLVLSRKVGERILIGDQIAVTVVKIAHGGVRIGVEAPAELAVVREELAGRLLAAEQEAKQRATGGDVSTNGIPNT